MMLQRVVDRLERAFGRGKSNAALPIIGGCVSTSGSQAVFRDVPNIGEQIGPLTAPVASPEAPPIIGIKRGTEYAVRFAADFIGWVRRNSGPTVSLTDDRLLEISLHNYATALGIPVPPDRSLLAAIKKMPGIEVRANRRGYTADGSKTTVYVIRQLNVDTGTATSAVSGSSTEAAARRAA